MKSSHYTKRQAEDNRQFAYRALRDMILTFHLQPGERLPEVALAQELNISRTPVHDALERLCRDHLVSPQEAHGFQVSSISTKRVKEALWLVDLFTTDVIHAFFTGHVAKEKIEILRFMLDEGAQARKNGHVHLFMRTIYNFFTQLFTFGGEYSLIWRALMQYTFDLQRIIYLIGQNEEAGGQLLRNLQSMVASLSVRNDDAACAAEEAFSQYIIQELNDLSARYPQFFENSAGSSSVQEGRGEQTQELQAQ
ncbi:MAG: GntR family transcriptional regulator [Lachnospiraceae bacterium]|nr:GntR family transcriptional regulator [Lachnospiraceae bacterium]